MQCKLREKLDRAADAFLHIHEIDRGTYERQRDRISERLTLAQIELQQARCEALDVAGVLGFAEHLIAHIGRTWLEGSLADPPVAGLPRSIKAGRCFL